MPVFPLRRRQDVDGQDVAPLRALLVDDDEHYRTFLAHLIGDLGFHVATAQDGQAGVELFGSGTFDLVIVDCEMPRMSGLDLIVELRRHERAAETYAVMLTGREDTQTKLNALRAGFDDFLTKSASEPEIVAKLGAARRLVTRHRRLDAAVRELYGLATRDELTGLFNRRFFYAEAERLIEEGADVSFVLFDLDDFKRVNDTYGHLAGDRILRVVGSLFLRQTRHEDLMARYGGDEFVMLVRGSVIAEVEALSARLGAELGRLQWTFGVDTVGIGVSTGFACSTLLDQPSVARLLSAGDRDLYKNKWMRRHPDLDVSLYEYDRNRAERLLDFPVPAAEEKKQRAE
jgi:two-component system cell cycle response regulator